MKKSALNPKSEHVATNPQDTWDKMRALVSKAVSVPKPDLQAKATEKRVDKVK